MITNFNNNKDTMSSLEIAEHTNKLHKDVLKAIRKMEPTWEKVTGLKFQLSEYKDQTGRKLPFFVLNKNECLYIATKFNDEARAKLVLRWEELEKQRLNAEQEQAYTYLDSHTKREVQVKNAKNVNGYLFKNWDLETVIEYNRRNCEIVTGKTPSEIKKIGKKAGLKSKQCASGKEVIRNLRPELAAQMSINDELVNRGVKLKEANNLSAPCIPLIKKLTEMKLIKT